MDENSVNVHRSCVSTANRFHIHSYFLITRIQFLISRTTIALQRKIISWYQELPLHYNNKNHILISRIEKTAWISGCSRRSRPLNLKVPIITTESNWHVDIDWRAYLNYQCRGVVDCGSQGSRFKSHRGTNVLWQDIDLHLPLSTQVLNGHPVGCES